MAKSIIISSPFPTTATVARTLRVSRSRRKKLIKIMDDLASGLPIYVLGKPLKRTVAKTKKKK